MNTDLITFLQAWTGGADVSDAERQRLLQRLQTDADFRAECAEEIRLLGMIKAVQTPPPRWLGIADALGLNAETMTTPGTSDFANEVMNRVRQREPKLQSSRSRWLSWRPLAAAAAVFIALLGLVALWWPQQGVAVEVLQATSDVSAEWTKGSRVRLDEVKLVYGEVQMRLSSGVVLDVTAPVEMKFLDAMHVRLLHGRMSADVGEQGKGFTVLTDAGEVVDLGTQFGVESDAKGESRVAVFSGEVKVRTGGSGGEFTKFTSIHEGEAVRFTALAGLRRWTEVALAVDAAGLERTPREGVIASARDNLGREKLHPFYGIVHAGMHPGALAFTDKPNPRWAPMPGETLPSWLQGADLVRTYHSFRHKRDYELTLTLRESADVSVLIDARQEPPAWLKERFTDSGARVRVGPWMAGMTKSAGVEIGNDGAPYLSFAVWRTKAAAGELVLGPAHVEEAKNAAPVLMYGVAVKALTPKATHSN
jgi:anti-sigma factor RsiW